MGIATFDYDMWAILYPAFTDKVLEPQATALFNQAGLLYLDNSDCSRVQDVNARQQILYLITAHLAAMSPQGGNQGQVGRLSDASQGTVHARFEYKGTEDSQWWDQTTYGTMAYQALRPYRVGFYAPPPLKPINPIGRGFRNGYSSWPY